MRTVGNTVQNATGQGRDLLKRPNTTITAQNDNSKKQRLDNSGNHKFYTLNLKFGISPDLIDGVYYKGGY